MVELTSGRLFWVPAAASARQPAVVVSVIDMLLVSVSAGVRASISTRWPIFDLIATHLQQHLAITKMILPTPIVEILAEGGFAAGPDALTNLTNALAAQQLASSRRTARDGRCR